ncbi:uncharacterized protein LOC134241538 [Saccostrea cucullata]|uniref:uncharacterized protein LOC134241538 n=1 Tax=Saccostrea cuccullata TaxID=36930 RepID=UPI002ECFE34A
MFSIVLEQTELNDAIYPTYQNIASDVQNRMSQLEQEYDDLFTAIIKHGEDWHSKIDKLVQKLIDEVNERKNEQIQTLQKNLNEIREKMSTIRNEINFLVEAVDSKDISKLFSVKSNVKEYRRIPPTIMPPLPRFKTKRIDERELCTLFGALSTSDENGSNLKIEKGSSEAGSSPPVKQLLDEPNIITTIDTGYEDTLYNVACRSDEEIWTKGFGNIVKLFNINEGSLFRSIKTTSGNIPPHVAVTKGGDLVYTDDIDRTVNIVNNGKIEKLISLQNCVPRHVCCNSSGDLLVVLTNERIRIEVVRYNGFIEKQRIQFDYKGIPLFPPLTTNT